MGIEVFFTMSFKAIVDSSSGQEILTISAPTACIALTCSIVPLISVVSVLVMD